MLGRTRYLQASQRFLHSYKSQLVANNLNFQYHLKIGVCAIDQFRNFNTRMVYGKQEIKSAGCLIIGDEVLSGKIQDTNSHEFAKFCFKELSIPLTKIIVCSDDESDIIESLATLVSKCDMVITSGGIGPTHDDVTYDSIAKMYNLDCLLDDEITQRMHSLREDYLSTLSAPQLEAYYKMATIPKSEELVEKFYVDDSLWLPVVAVDKKVFVLPGVPQLFIRLLEKIKEIVHDRLIPFGLKRRFVKTTSKESELAPYLTKLQTTCDEKYGKGNIKLGSYPHLAWKMNTISIIGSKNIQDGDLELVVDSIIENIRNSSEIDENEETTMTTQDP